MNDEEQADLQNAELKFYPQLGTKTREAREVYLTTASGKICRGIQVWRGKVKMPLCLVLHNCPEISERQVPLSESTQKWLTKRIKDMLFNAAAGLL